MFENLNERLQNTIKGLRGQARLTEDNIKDALRDVRLALLEADVALPVVKDFIDQIRERAVGQEVQQSLNPGQALIKIVNDELVRIMGDVNEDLNLKTQPPAVILMAGLQGSGKTTSVAKLARWLQERHKKTVMVTSCDVYRPAAIDQLKTLAAEVNADFFPSTPEQKPHDIARAALEQARRQATDVLIVDSAGRLAIDEAMMVEIKELHGVLNPIETLFVVDSMTGQDAANTAKTFDETLALTGVILTKTDGDARGGAALSIRQVTGKPIKFLGVGEKTDALEPFYPDRVASRILGMGDMLGLIEDIERKVDKSKAEKLARKFKKGKTFDLSDFREQMQEMLNMGGIGEMLEKLPGMSEIPAEVKAQADDSQVRKIIAIINSMTLQERRFPDVINGSRKRRIAGGSGTQIQDINRLLKQFKQSQKMMKKMKGGGMAKMMRGMKGRFPGGGQGPGAMR